MIVDELYTVGETTLTHSGVDYEDIVTGTIPSSNFTCDAYYLGWISSANIPALGKKCQAYKEINEDDHNLDSITLYTLTDEGNFPCGYAWTDKTRHNGLLTNPGRYSDVKMVNQLYPEYSATVPRKFYITFAYILFNTGGVETQLYPTTGNPGNLGQIELTMEQLYGCYKYGWEQTLTETQRTLTITYQSAEIDVILTDEIMNKLKEDNGEDSPVIDINLDNYHVKFWISSFSCTCVSSTGYSTDSPFNTFVPGEYESPVANFSFFYKGTVSYTDTIDGILGNGNDGEPVSGQPDYGFSTKWFEQGYYLSDSYYTAVLEVRNDFAIRNNFIDVAVPFGAHSTCQRQQIWQSQLYYFVNGNCVWINTSYPSGTSVQVYPMLVWGDLYKAVALMYRVCFGGEYSDGYRLGITYATDVSSIEEFKADLKTGVLADPSFKEGLRPWQYSEEGIQIDEFTEEDVPEGGGGEDDTPGDEPKNLPHDDGTVVPNQPNRSISVPSLFLTQYALTSDELQIIGENLWSSWLDPNLETWKNFYLPYAADFGTLNIGAALDFIVSLKVFPFEFTIDWIVPNNDGVRMGTGHTDFLGSAAPMVKTQIISLYAGRCKVSPTIPYNDFRDMYNCSVSVFIPYCGTVDLTPAEVMNRFLKLWYFIDLQSGSCTGVVVCEGDAGEYNVAAKTGQIGYTLPMTATNAGQLAATYASDAMNVAKTLSGFYFDTAKTIGGSVLSALGAKAGNGSMSDVQNYNAFTSAITVGKSAVNTEFELANQALNVLSRSGIDVPFISGGGNAESFMFGAGGYVQIRRGKYAKPDNYPHSQAHLNGSSNKISYYRGAFSGNPKTGSATDRGLCKFTGVDSSGLTCHADERAEILSLLESGIYI